MQISQFLEQAKAHLSGSPLGPEADFLYAKSLQDLEGFTRSEALTSRVRILATHVAGDEPLRAAALEMLASLEQGRGPSLDQEARRFGADADLYTRRLRKLKESPNPEWARLMEHLKSSLSETELNWLAQFIEDRGLTETHLELPIINPKQVQLTQFLIQRAQTGDLLAGGALTGFLEHSLPKASHHSLKSTFYDPFIVFSDICWMVPDEAAKNDLQENTWIFLDRPENLERALFYLNPKLSRLFLFFCGNQKQIEDLRIRIRESFPVYIIGNQEGNQEAQNTLDSNHEFARLQVIASLVGIQPSVPISNAKVISFSRILETSRPGPQDPYAVLKQNIERSFETLTQDIKGDGLSPMEYVRVLLSLNEPRYLIDEHTVLGIVTGREEIEPIQPETFFKQWRRVKRETLVIRHEEYPRLIQSEGIRKIEEVIQQTKSALQFKEKLEELMTDIAHLPVGQKGSYLSRILDLLTSSDPRIVGVTEEVLKTLDPTPYTPEELEALCRTIMERALDAKTEEPCALLYISVVGRILPHTTARFRTPILQRILLFVSQAVLQVGDEAALSRALEVLKMKSERLTAGYFDYLVSKIDFSSLFEKGLTSLSYRQLKKTIVSHVRGMPKYDQFLDQVLDSMAQLISAYQQNLALAVLDALMGREKSDFSLDSRVGDKLIRYLPDSRQAEMVQEMIPRILQSLADGDWGDPLLNPFGFISELFPVLGIKAKQRAMFLFFDQIAEHHHLPDFNWQVDMDKVMDRESDPLELFEYEFFWGYNIKWPFLEEITSEPYLQSKFVQQLLVTTLFKVLPKQWLARFQGWMKWTFGPPLSRDALRGYMRHAFYLLEGVYFQEFEKIITTEGFDVEGIRPSLKFYDWIMGIDSDDPEEMGRLLNLFYTFPVAFREDFVLSLKDEQIPFQKIRGRLNDFLEKGLSQHLDLSEEMQSKLHTRLQTEREIWIQEDLLPQLLFMAYSTNKLGKAQVRSLLERLISAPITDGRLVAAGDRFKDVEKILSEDQLEKWKKERLVPISEEGFFTSKEQIYQRAYEQVLGAMQLVDHEDMNQTHLRDFFHQRYRNDVIPKHQKEMEDVLEALSHLLVLLQTRKEIPAEIFKPIDEFYNHLGHSSFMGLPREVQETILITRILESTLQSQDIPQSKEAVRLTHDVAHMINKGRVPVLTCQRCHERTGQNGSGEPIAMILLGQFKLAQYLLNGEVIARSVLEIEKHKDGLHLKAERLHPDKRFTQIHEKRFDAAILDLARDLGVPEENVHIVFTQRKMKTAPLSNNHGKRIYRDTFKPDPTTTLEAHQRMVDRLFTAPEALGEEEASSPAISEIPTGTDPDVPTNLGGATFGNLAHNLWNVPQKLNSPGNSAILRMVQQQTAHPSNGVAKPGNLNPPGRLQNRGLFQRALRNNLHRNFQLTRFIRH